MRFKIIFIALVLLLISCTEKNEIAVKMGSESQYEELILTSFRRVEAYDFDSFDDMKIVITSHHLPVAVDLITRIYKTISESKMDKSIFVIIGPDHAEACSEFVTLNDNAYVTSFGNLSVNSEIVNALKDGGVSVQPDCFILEHSINVQTELIKYIRPDSEIVPILISSSTPNSVLLGLTDILNEFWDEIYIIGSLDFSHYRSIDAANQYDDATQRIIMNYDSNLLTLKNVDSPPTLKLILDLAKDHNLKPTIFEHVNSGELGSSSDNTTGYMNVVFY